MPSPERPSQEVPPPEPQLPPQPLQGFEGSDSAPSPPPEGPEHGGKDLFTTGWFDYVQYHHHGRFVAFFPAVCVCLVYGGRWVRRMRLWDQFYGIFGVVSVDVFKSRKTPTHQAQVVLSNAYNALGNASFQHVLDQAVARGYQPLEYSPEEQMLGAGGALEQWWRHLVQSVFPYVSDYERRVYELELRSLFVRPGTRLHIRMGYGANAGNLPVVFNGTIGTVQFEDQLVQLSALGDGVELEKPVRPTNVETEGNKSTQYYRYSGLFGLAVEPRQVVVDTMTTTRRDDIPVLGPLIYAITTGSYLNGSTLGINNFGLTFMNPTGSPNPGETCVNVYNSTPYGENISSGMWGVADLFALLVPGWDAFRPGVRISIDMANGTIWDVFQACRLSVLDYVAGVEPFDLRSTLFIGRRDYPIYYTYMSPGEASATYGSRWNESIGIDEIHKLMRYKQFQQFHTVSSEDDLISNKVSLSYEGIITDAAARDTTGVAGNMLMLDPMIIQEDRREAVVDSALNTSAINLLWPGSSNASWISWVARFNPIRSTIGERWGLAMPVREVNNIAANVIRDSLGDMYQGEIQIAGRASLKPYDLLFLVDDMRRMSGPVAVKEVHHHFSPQRGFVSTISPDLVTLGLNDKEYFHVYRFVTMAAQGVFDYQMLKNMYKLVSLRLFEELGGLYARPYEVFEDIRDVQAMRKHGRRVRGLAKESRFHAPFKDLQKIVDAETGQGGLYRKRDSVSRLLDWHSRNAQSVSDLLTEIRKDGFPEIIQDQRVRRELQGWMFQLEDDMARLPNAVKELQDKWRSLEELEARYLARQQALVNLQKSGGKVDAAAVEELGKLQAERDQLRGAVDELRKEVDGIVRRITQFHQRFPQAVAHAKRRLSRLLVFRLRTNFGDNRYWRDALRSTGILQKEGGEFALTKQQMDDLREAANREAMSAAEAKRAKKQAEKSAEKAAQQVEEASRKPGRWRRIGRAVWRASTWGPRTAYRIIRNRGVRYRPPGKLKLVARGMFIFGREWLKTFALGIYGLFAENPNWDRTAGNVFSRWWRTVRWRPALHRPPAEILQGIRSGFRKLIPSAVTRTALVFMGIGHLLELINRKINSVYVCSLVPLKSAGKPFLSGLRGHAGSVVGDSPGFWQQLLASWNPTYYEQQVLPSVNISPWMGKAIQMVANTFLLRERNPMAALDLEWDWQQMEFYDSAEAPLRVHYGDLRVLGSKQKSATEGIDAAAEFGETVAVRYQTEWEIDRIRHHESELRRALEYSRSIATGPPPHQLIVPVGTNVSLWSPPSDAQILGYLDPRAAQTLRQYLEAVRRRLNERTSGTVGVLSLIHI